MKSSKGHTTQEEDEEYDEDFTSKKEGTSNNNNNHNKDVKSNDKASAIRSKHSVTEQRRRSKINERFQLLRDLIPHGDQKRDTASFLLEVIEYVQVLQEKVQKYEGSYQEWGEPTKLMPWRHSHWRVQSYLGHPQSVKNGPGSGSGSASTFAGNMDERNFSSNPSLIANLQTAEIDSGHEAYRNLDESEMGEKAASLPTSFHVHAPDVLRSDGDDSHLSQRPASDTLSTPCAIQSDEQPGEHAIEGGTISISSSYSHGLLMTLTQALQSSGVDLTEASISIRIDLGKRANPSPDQGMPISKEVENSVSQDLQIGHVNNGRNREELDHPQKKMRS